MNQTISHFILRIAVSLCAIIFAATTHADVVSIATVPVGDAGNANDSEADSGVTGGTGAVSYNYNIGKYDVTLTQYTAFLNAVAASDPNNLWNPFMATKLYIAGISQSGSSGSYSYAVIGDGQRPVTYVSWYDAARFCNWLTNGQGSGGTETGVYTLIGPTSISGTLPADHSALVGTGTKWFIPTESEWYKAAYYNAAGANYYAYPFQSNTQPTVNNPVSLNPNSGNFNNGVFATTQSSSFNTSLNYLTDVGAYVATSPYGSYDMGGDVYQWNETVHDGSSLGLRGGDWNIDSGFSAASHRNGTTPTNELYDIGFRVAEIVSLPEPSSFVLLGFGILGLLGYLRRRRRTAS